MKKLYIIFLVSLPFLSMAMTKEKRKKEVLSLQELVLPAAYIANLIKGTSQDFLSGNLPAVQQNYLQNPEDINRLFQKLKQTTDHQQHEVIINNDTSHSPICYKVQLLSPERVKKLTYHNGKFFVLQDYPFIIQEDGTINGITIPKISHFDCSPNNVFVLLQEFSTPRPIPSSIAFIGNRRKPELSQIKIFSHSKIVTVKWQSLSHFLVAHENSLQVYNSFLKNEVANIFVGFNRIKNVLLSPSKKTLVILFAHYRYGIKQYIKIYDWITHKKIIAGRLTSNPIFAKKEKWQKRSNKKFFLSKPYNLDATFSCNDNCLIFIREVKEKNKLAIDTYSIDPFKLQRSDIIDFKYDFTNPPKIKSCSTSSLIVIEGSDGAEQSVIFDTQSHTVQHNLPYNHVELIDDTTFACHNSKQKPPLTVSFYTTLSQPKFLEQALLLNLLKTAQEMDLNKRNKILQALKKSEVYKTLEPDCPVSKTIKSWSLL